MPTLLGPASKATAGLTQSEKELGIDLKLTGDNDLELSNLNDIKLIKGGANAAQAIKIRLLTEPGGLQYHPDLGTDLQIGSKAKDAFTIKAQIISSIGKDPRFEGVEANVQIDSGTIFVQIRVSVVNTGISVPLQFVVVT